jgi:hypothetical protein
MCPAGNNAEPGAAVWNNAPDSRQAPQAGRGAAPAGRQQATGGKLEGDVGNPFINSC